MKNLFKIFPLFLALLLAIPAQAAITFHVKGTALDAFRATGYSTHGSSGGTAVPAPISSAGITGAFGANVIDLSGTAKRITFNTHRNFPTGAFTILIRFAPKFTGGAAHALFSIGPASGNRTSGIDIREQANDQPCFLMQDALGSVQVNDCTTAPIGTVTDQMMDLWITYDNATALKVFAAQNGNSPTQIGSTITSSSPTGGARQTITSSSMMIADGAILNGGDFLLDELVIFDTVEVPSSYGARSTYISDTAFDGLNSTDPGITNVNVGTTYTIAGVLFTGTKTTPVIGDVKHGVTFGASLGLTGTYRGLDLNTDVGVANVLSTASYTFDGSTLTGTYVAAPVNRVRSGFQYGVGGTALTGTDLSTDPGESFVNNGVNYTINSTAHTGSFIPVCNSIPPDVEDVRAGLPFSVDGIAYVGELDLPTAGNVKTGTTFDGGVAGTLTCTDPGQGNVASGIGYNIYSVAKTGTLEAVTNYFTAAILKPNTTEPSGTPLTLTQGDTALFALIAESNDGTLFDLSGSVFTGYIRGPQGDVEQFANAKFTAAADQTTNKGEFTFALTAADTNLLEPGRGKEIMVKVVQGPSTKYFRGKLLDVLPSFPSP